MMRRKNNYLLDKILELQSQGRYTFSLQEMKQAFRVSRDALNKSLSRLSQKGKIVSVRKGFYVIVPPEYAAKQILPPPLFIDPMMAYIQKPYYVGLLSAAAMHGAAHQQPQVFQVITNIPALRPIRVKNLSIQFFSKRKFTDSGVMQKKTDTGYVNVSSPELTLMDLIQFYKQVGGLGRVLDVLDELTEACDPKILEQLLANGHFQIATLQRAGYLLENLLDHPQLELAEVIFNFIKDKPLFPVLLNRSAKKRFGRAHNRWKVVQNDTKGYEQ